ncbi:MAG: glycosyltransferase family 2 protein [bacterium]
MSEVRLRLLSIIVPFLNERDTLRPVVERVLAADTAGLERELILVDDGSGDGSTRLARALTQEHACIRLLRSPVNRGKGAALRRGLAVARGELILIQDADLEYSPEDYPALLGPLLEDRADVVYGTRFADDVDSRFPMFAQRLGNRLLTRFSNALTGLELTDMETCYKVFRADVLRRVSLREDRFGFEPEATAKIARLRPRPRVLEVPIGYRARTREAGKKIGWTDGLRALYCIARYNLFP